MFSSHVAVCLMDANICDHSLMVPTAVCNVVLVPASLFYIIIYVSNSYH